MAVLDERLRVRGVAGLRVIDASVMPAITSGNTAAPDHDDRREGGGDDDRGCPRRLMEGERPADLPAAARAAAPRRRLLHRPDPARRDGPAALPARSRAGSRRCASSCGWRRRSPGCRAWRCWCCSPCRCAVAEPLKIVGLVMIGRGQVALGGLVLALAYLASFLIVERIYHAGRDKLLSYGWLAWTMGHLVRLRRGRRSPGSGPAPPGASSARSATAVRRWWRHLRA